ncbi:MAG: SDR family oxidoreductase [Alphaproteobacteria bacterium]|nr:SDR family oxidoreductase [Alphaproteobacteria bacterium]MCB9698872.1 SDR family oxidoreductase [Alphaproteobacteria bacterium]
MQLSDLKAIVTGGASGMGRTFAMELARGGATVVVADLDQAKMDEVVAAGEGRIHAIRCNVAQEEDVVALIDGAHEKMGGLNALINNAGIFRDGLLVKQDKETGAVKKMSLDAWNAVIAVDLTGPFLCTREFAAKMIATGTKKSCIVNISSIARHGNQGQTNYSAAKAGLVADTKLWGLELARYGIRVGAIAPGFVDTPILQGMRPDVLEGMLKGVPLRRAAAPEEIFQAVRFVLECDYFTGRCIDVDGGLTL